VPNDLCLKRVALAQKKNMSRHIVLLVKYIVWQQEQELNFKRMNYNKKSEL